VLYNNLFRSVNPNFLQQTPQVSSSAKKLKFKPLTSSAPKTANGATPKSTTKKDSASKPSKSKPKKSTTNGTAEKAAPATPKEPELSPEEKRVKKEVSLYANYLIKNRRLIEFVEGDPFLETQTAEGPLDQRSATKRGGDEADVRIY
jgi:hypothetical protein